MINTKLLNVLTKDQAYQTYIQNPNLSQTQINDLAEKCLKLQIKPEGLIRGMIGRASAYIWKSEEKTANIASITILEAEDIKDKLADLARLFEKAEDIRDKSTDKDFTIACDLVNIHYDILIEQWELLETLYDILDRKKPEDPSSQELQKSIHSLLKTVILQIGHEMNDPLLSNEEVVLQIIQHHSELSEVISDVKEMLSMYVEKDVNDAILGGKFIGEEGHQMRFQAQMCRVARWRLENKLAIHLQSKLTIVDPKNTLDKQRKELLVHLKQEYDKLKEYKKEMQLKKFSIPSTNEISNTTQEVWMLSDYGGILLEKDPKDLYQQSFDESFRKTLSSLKTKKLVLKNERDAIKGKLDEQLAKYTKYPELEKNPTEKANEQKIKQELGNKEQELKAANMMIRYTVLKRTMEKIGSYQLQLNQTKKELPEQIKAYEIAQATFDLFQEYQKNIEQKIEKPTDFDETVWNKALTRQKNEISGLRSTEIGQPIDATKKEIKSLENELEETQVTLDLYRQYPNEQFKKPENVNEKVWKKAIEKLNQTRQKSNVSYEIEYTIASAERETDRLEKKLEEAQATLYLHQQYEVLLQKEFFKPEHFTDEVWNIAVSELIRQKTQTSALSPSEIKKTIASAQKDVERLEKEVKNSQSKFLLLPEKINILNENFSKQLAHYERLWTKPTEGQVLTSLKIFWNSLKGKLSLGYLSEVKFPSLKEIREQHHFANLGYSMTDELYNLGKEVVFQKIDYSELGKEFLDWAQRHPETAANIASDFVQAFAIFSQNNNAALTLASGIKTKVLLHSVIKQISLIRPDTTALSEKEIKQELRFRALAELAHYSPMIAKGFQTTQAGLENIGKYGSVFGPLKTFFDHGLAQATTDTIQQVVTELEVNTAMQALRFASYVDYVFLSNAYVDSAIRMENLTISNQVLDIYEALKSPKKLMDRVGKEISHWWRRLKYADTLAARLAHAAPAAATVGVVAITIVAIIGGPISWGLAATAWSFYLPFILYTYPTMRSALSIANSYQIENRIIHEDVLKEAEKKEQYLKTKIDELIAKTMANLRKHKLIPTDLKSYENKLSPEALEFIQSSTYVSKRDELQKNARKKLEEGLAKKKELLKSSLQKQEDIKSPPLTIQQIMYVLKDDLLFENPKEFAAGSEAPQTFRKLIGNTVKDIKDLKQPQKRSVDDLKEEISVYLYTDLMNYISTDWLTATMRQETYDTLLEETQKALLKAEMNQQQGKPVDSPPKKEEVITQDPQTTLIENEKILKEGMAKLINTDQSVIGTEKAVLLNELNTSPLFSLGIEPSGNKI